MNSVWRYSHFTFTMDTRLKLGLLLAFSFEFAPQVFGGNPVPGKVSNAETTFVTSSAIGLSWTASTSNISFTNYVIFVMMEGKCKQAYYINCSPNQTLYLHARCCYINSGPSASYDECHGNMSYKVQSLASYTDYVITVAAAYKDTVGENYTLTAKTDIGVPTSPTNIRLTAVNQSAIFVKWDIPSHNAGPMTYKVTVLQAMNRMPSDFISHREYLVEGWTSSFLPVTGLLSSWRYMVGMTASTIAGTSSLAKSKPVTTLASSPSVVQNINMKFVPTQYLAVQLTWECPPEKMRNGHITNYTVKYTGNVSMTMTAGSFYPEDPCTAPHSVYLPVIPDEKLTVEIWANAEFKGNESALIFLADREQMYYGFPSNSSVTDTKPVIIASVTLVSVIVILVVAVSALFLKR